MGPFFFWRWRSQFLSQVDLRSARMLLGEVSQHRQLEHLTLERFHHEDKPQQDSRQCDDHIDHRDQERPEQRDEKNGKSGEPERGAQHNDRTRKQQALDGMETHKPILPVGVDEQKHNRGHEGEISQSARKIYGQRPNLAFNARFRPARSFPSASPSAFPSAPPSAPPCA